MITKKLALLVIFSIPFFNTYGMKRRGDEITKKSSSKKQKISTSDTEPTIKIEEITYLEHLPAKPIGSKIKQTIPAFPVTIDSEKGAPELKKPVYPVKTIITPTEKQKKKLYETIEQNDYQGIEKYLKKGIDPNTILTTGFSLLDQTADTKCLCTANDVCNCEEKAMKITTSLILNGANLNANAYRNGPLHYAVTEGKALLAQLLINYGANPNHQGDENSTPLHYAADIKEIETAINMAKCLIINGASPIIKDVDGSTPRSIIINRDILLNDKQEFIKVLTTSPRKEFFNKKTGNPFVLARRQQVTGKNHQFLLLKK